MSVARGAQLALLLIASTASADDTLILTGRWREVPLTGGELKFTERWREVPTTGGESKIEEQHVLDNLNDLGNFLGTEVNKLSGDYVALKFDGRRNRARLRLGTGDGQGLRFNVDSDWHFLPD